MDPFDKCGGKILFIGEKVASVDVGNGEEIQICRYKNR
jgi:hypothetical protein